MFRRSKGITVNDLPRYLAKGYGSGEGSNYQPMIHVQDFPSRGWRNREIGWKTGRQHDYFSNPELYYHYILDHSKSVTDFREQFPLLPIERTLEIAQQCGIRHPIDTMTREPIVMTTDFLILYPESIGTSRKARTIKLSKDLTKRTIEKFEIERRYWLSLGVHWAIVTERDIDMQLVGSLRWVHKFLPVSSLEPLTEDDVRRIAIPLTRLLASTTDKCLGNIAQACDKQLGLESGQSLAVARHLIASRQWCVDMTKTIHPLERIELIDNSVIDLKSKKGAGRANSKKRLV
jgi:hypothetical protein